MIARTLAPGALLLAPLLVLAIVGISCGSESTDHSTPPPAEEARFEERPGEFDGLAREVLLNMTSLPSYAMDVSITLPEQDARGEDTWTFEFEAPDSYRFLRPVFTGPEEQFCYGPSVLQPNGSRTCYSIMTRVDGMTVTEAVLAGDGFFSRTCDTPGSNCSPWEHAERPQGALSGPSPTYLPEFPLFLVREIRNGVAGHSGGALQLRGEVNPTLTGLMAMECLRDAPVPYDQSVITSCDHVPPETIEQQQEAISAYDDAPAPVVVWLTEDMLVVRILLTVPGHEDGPDFTASFSYEYRQIEISEP